MIFTATLAYQGDNPKFNIFHGSKVYDESIPPLFQPEASALLPAPVTVGGLISIGPDATGANEVIGWSISDSSGIHTGIPTSGTLDSFALSGLIAKFISKSIGTVSEAISITFELESPAATPEPPVQSAA